MIFQGKARYPVTGAVLHCAAVPTGWADGKTPAEVYRQIDGWHRERGFASFGYHGLVMPGGAYYAGRPWSQIGAHVKEANRGTLGFLLIESRKIDRLGDFGEWFTDRQRVTLRGILAAVPGLRWVRGHNDYAAKLCPGFRVQSADWLPRG